MKTKIIYISGNEVFEMTQIRATFEEVRSALGLDNDTILFGVPVDSDSALACAPDRPVSTDAGSTDVVQSHVVTEPVVDTPEDVIQNASVVCESEPVVTEKPQKKSRARRAVNKDAPATDAVVDIEITENISPDSIDSDKVIPILSILSAQEDETNIPDAPVAEDAAPIVASSVDVVVDATVDTEPVSETVVISDVDINSQLVAPVATDDAVVEKITIGDMIEDAAPVAPVEKTLEQLLESMTPLREDVTLDDTDTSPDSEIDDDASVSDADTDATLAQLASEFAQTEDKIVTPARNESQGKIGKLKNILPFKKAKRDDNSLMGDLFGWAGVAANDEDFSIPGFFTQAKKQGA